MWPYYKPVRVKGCSISGDISRLPDNIQFIRMTDGLKDSTLLGNIDIQEILSNLRDSEKLIEKALDILPMGEGRDDVF